MHLRVPRENYRNAVKAIGIELPEVVPPEASGSEYYSRDDVLMNRDLLSIINRYSHTPPEMIVIPIDRRDEHYFEVRDYFLFDNEDHSKGKFSLPLLDILLRGIEALSNNMDLADTFKKLREYMETYQYVNLQFDGYLEPYEGQGLHFTSTVRMRTSPLVDIIWKEEIISPGFGESLLKNIKANGVNIREVIRDRKFLKISYKDIPVKNIFIRQISFLFPQQQRKEPIKRGIKVARQSRSGKSKRKSKKAKKRRRSRKSRSRRKSRR